MYREKIKRTSKLCNGWQRWVISTQLHEWVQNQSSQSTPWGTPWIWWSWELDPWIWWIWSFRSRGVWREKIRVKLFLRIWSRLEPSQTRP
jgi:hypothetical protein